MESIQNNEPTLLQSLIAEELRNIKVIYCPPGTAQEMSVLVKNGKLFNEGVVMTGANYSPHY